MPRDFSKAKTSVFWDVEDFPNPNGRSIYEIIKSALEKEGYHGEVSISAYGEKKPDNLDDDGVIAFMPKRGKYARLNKMLLDIALWSIDIIRPVFPVPAPTNLMVITKNIPEDTEFAGYLGLLQSHDCNVLLVVAHDCAPEEAPLPDVYTIWFWKSLLDGGKPLDPIQLRSLLARVKRETFRRSEEIEPKVVDHTPCPICQKVSSHRATFFMLTQNKKTVRQFSDHFPTT